MASDATFPTIGVPTPDTGSRGVPSALPGQDQRSVFTQPPSGPSPASFLDKINYDGLEQFGASVDNLTQKLVIDPKIQQAQQDGAQTVVRDPTTGELQPPALQGGPFVWNHAFNDAAMKGYNAQAALDLRAKALEIAQANPQDPQAFQGLYKTYTNQDIAKAPAWARGDLNLVSMQESQRLADGLYQDKFQAQVANDKLAILNERGTAADELTAYSRNDLIGTPDAILAKQRFDALSAQLISNKGFGYTQADADKDAQDLTTKMQVEGILGHTERAAKTDGTAAALDLLHQAMWDPHLTIDDAERNAGEARGRAIVSEQGAVARQTAEQMRQYLDSVFADAKAEAASKGEFTGTIPQVSSLFQAYGPYEGARKLEELNEAVAGYAAKKALALATPAQAQSLIAQSDPQNHPELANAKPPMSLADAILGQESGGNPNAPTSVTGATGPMQIEPATFARFAHPGESISNPADNRAVGQRIVNTYLQKYGNDPARAAVAYFSGEGNVAPPGSPTPYVQDKLSPTSTPGVTKSTSSYVQDVMNRMGFGQDGGRAAVLLREHKALLQVNDERNLAIRNDPAAYVAQNRPDVAAAVTSGDPATRFNGVRALLQQETALGVPPDKQTILTKDHAADLMAGFDSGNPSDAVAHLKNFTAGLPPYATQIIARQIAPKNAAYAAAVSASATSPTMAADIAMGERYLQQNPDVRPKDDLVGAAVDSVTAGSKGVMSSTGGLFEGAPDARRPAIAAAVALYGRQSIGQGAGSSTATFNRDRFSQAFDQVVGHPFNYRGQIIVAPSEGMNSGNMDDLMSRVDDKAIKTYANGWPTDATGHPIPADVVSRQGVLVYSGAPGIYRVKLPGQGFLAVHGSNNAAPRTFMIDLRHLVGTP
jgi:hypothetical protein